MLPGSGDPEFRLPQAPVSDELPSSLTVMASPLKDHVTVGTAERLAAAMTEVDGRFDAGAFVTAVRPHLVQLELKERVNLLADELAEGLDAAADYPTALASVDTLAETEPLEHWADGMFAAWPLCSFVERHGVDHPTESLVAMPTLTKRWSCEFAIRPFLDNPPGTDVAPSRELAERRA